MAGLASAALDEFPPRSVAARLARSVRGVHLALFPPVCASCGGFLASNPPHPSGLHPYLCASCSEALDWRVAARCCRNCGRPVADPPPPGLAGWLRCPACPEEAPAWDSVAAAFGYEDPVRRWILRFKYYREDYLAPMLGAMLARTIEESGSATDVDAVVPVPLHPSRIRRRGFSQSHLLAERALAALRQQGQRVPPLRVDLIRRHRPTRPQTELSFGERRANVEGAFSLPPAPKRIRGTGGMPAREALAGAHVLLVDDVLTTGATLEACASALKAAGARRVSAVVLARA
jgi:ComF family protein